jgi:4-amino-4-deoxy-L-arabinose transferase-like glycosyltransferase
MGTPSPGQSLEHQDSNSVDTEPFIPRERSRTVRPIGGAALVLVVFAAMLPRLNHIDKSIWSAEAWVANSVLADSYWHMLQYQNWLQTTPPLFLVLERISVHIAGPSVASFRAIPFALAILSLAMMAWLSRRILSPAFAVVCTTLVALSPPAVVFSKEVKQYSGDVAATCLLLLALWAYLERSDNRRYAFVMLAFVVALLLSYPAVVFIPMAIAALGVSHAAEKYTRASLRCDLQKGAALATLALAVCGANYWFLVRPNTSALLTDYWSAGYPRFSHLPGAMRFYTEYFLGMFVYFYLPIDAKNVLASVISSVGYIPVLLIGFGIIAILAVGIRSLRHNVRHLAAVGLCLSPLCVLFVLNLLRLYPINSRRLTLFMLPCITLCTSMVIEGFWTALTRRIRPQVAEWCERLIVIACVLSVLGFGVWSDNWSNYWFEDEDTAGALSFIKSHMEPEDTIYVHASIEEPAKLYFQILHWHPSDVRYGNTGWGCCKRNPEQRPADMNSVRDYVIGDFERVMQKKASGRLWLIFTGRDDGWPNFEREEPQIIAAYLYRNGCRKQLDKRFANEVVNQFVCGSTANEIPVNRLEDIPESGRLID